MGFNFHVISLVFSIIMLCFFCINIRQCSSCIARERQALAVFKNSLEGPRNYLSSWVGQDCCEWEGITCDNTTGHITELTLFASDLLGSNEVNPSLAELTHLQVLDLSYSNFTGSQIPEFFGNFTELRVLDIHSGRFEGVIPPSLGNLSTLTHLDLSRNELLKVDSLNWFSPLTSLQVLDLSYTNSTASQIPEFFGNFTDLRFLDLSFEGNLSTLKVDSLNWLSPLTSLVSLSLSRVNLSLTSSHWPQLLSSFHSLSELHLENCELYEFPLSHINNTLTNLELSNNHFHGQFPSVFQNITGLVYLYLNDNMFSGLIPSFVNDTMSSIITLDLSSNSFNGSVSNLCAIGSNYYFSIFSLDLSNNYFSGVIPSNCWSDVFPVQLNLENNDFTGVIPNTFRPRDSLHLGKNRFSGELPLSLKQCQNLTVLDIGANQFSGNLPSWIGGLSSLMILNLRQNKFGGILIPELCHLHDLQIVDVAENNFSGIIPACFKNFGGMKPNWTNNGVYSTDEVLEIENLVQVIKGGKREYKETLRYLFNLDLLSNNLDGSIPNELLSLTMLTSLNLSNNRLTGGIPKKIGDLNALESLDFSRNQLSGMIPRSITNISFLAVLNISYNNLEGQIPSGGQLQTFESPSYAGNPALCGVPLEKKCSQNDSSQGIEEKMEKEYKVFESKENYIGMALGIATGFWGILFILLFKQTWRYTCFRFVENVYDLLFVKW